MRVTARKQRAQCGLRSGPWATRVSAQRGGAGGGRFGTEVKYVKANASCVTAQRHLHILHLHCPYLAKGTDVPRFCEVLLAGSLLLGARQGRHASCPLLLVSFMPLAWGHRLPTAT